MFGQSYLLGIQEALNVKIIINRGIICTIYILSVGFVVGIAHGAFVVVVVVVVVGIVVGAFVLIPKICFVGIKLKVMIKIILNIIL
jgi:hypothetical protein